MTKTLYITDLDGTLLQNDARLSAKTTAALQRFRKAGVAFTAATARTAATVRHILGEAPPTVPAILMTGACLYDVETRTYDNVRVIPPASRKALVETLAKHGLDGFFYTIENGHLSTYYERAETPAALAFMRERIERYGKVFTKIDCAEKLAALPLVCYSVGAPEDKVTPAAAALRLDDAVSVGYYRDTYLKDTFYLEVYEKSATKYHAAKALRERYGFDRVVGFGDNLNDLPLFDACDVCVAVSNAAPAVLQRADFVAGSNTEDGVVRWIEEDCARMGIFPALD